MNRKNIIFALLVLSLAACGQKEGDKGVIFHFTPNVVQMDAFAGSQDIMVQYNEQPHGIILSWMSNREEIIYFPSPEDNPPKYKIHPEGVSYPGSEYKQPVTVEWEWLKITIEPGGETFRITVSKNETESQRSVILRWSDLYGICNETIEITQAAANDDQ